MNQHNPQIEFYGDTLVEVAYNGDSSSQRFYHQAVAGNNRQSWPVNLDMLPQPASTLIDTVSSHSPPDHTYMHQQAHAHQLQRESLSRSMSISLHDSPSVHPVWPIHHQPQFQDRHLISHAPVPQQYHVLHQQDFVPAPVEYITTQQDAIAATLHQLEGAYSPAMQADASAQVMRFPSPLPNWQDFQLDLPYGVHGHEDFVPIGLGRASLGSNSPTGTYLEVVSLPSSSSDNGWATVDAYQNFDAYQQAQNAVFNPGQTLHLRSHSDTSGSECFGSYEEISYSPASYSPYSPGSESYLDPVGPRTCSHRDMSHPHDHGSPAATGLSPTTMAVSISQRGSSSESSSPPARRLPGGIRKSASIKSSTSKVIVKRSGSTGKKDGEKRIGKRVGALSADQRKQASEIRKLGACLRCKFLKKTCSHGEPCEGCKPAHTRLWQVPCTRVDIKDLGKFMIGWKMDYDRTIGVIKIEGYGDKEETLWITHGYGFAIPIQAREVFVSADSTLRINWSESRDFDDTVEFDVCTENMSAGAAGISSQILSEYLEKHIEGPFEDFINEYFEGTAFITEILKTAHRYYLKEKLPIIGKALKLVLAYNLTMHITMVEKCSSEREMDSDIEDLDSKMYSKTLAPAVINFQIKSALAEMWRELQGEILAELSSLYSSVYSGQRLKNWPTIFMLASILLAVWEEMQFDAHYRTSDDAKVEQFCKDMESTPVGVIVGLFHAISQKLPAFTEWDTQKHGQLLNNNVAVCDAMTEMREHVTKHEDYLKARAKGVNFNRGDFDSMSNKFLSKLVIRTN